MSMAQNESELLARCCRGEADAWDVLFDEHYAPVGRFVFQLGLAFTPEDVEEICQETFISVIRNLRNFDGKCRFQTWLFRIASNKAMDYRERQTAAKRGGGQTPVSLEADTESGMRLDVPGSDPGPDVALMGRERVEMVHRALDLLGQPCREVIELRYFGDLSYEEISACLSTNVKTVSSRLSKCLDKLEGIVSGMLAEAKAPGFPSNR